MKRRTFLKRAALAGTALGGPAVLPQATRRARAAAAGRPNILVIIVDQLRFPQGLFDENRMDMVAPNLLRLRNESVSFAGHYTASNMCSPARSTMLTGLYTHQNGMFLTNLTSLTSGGAAISTPSLNPGFPTYGSILSSPDFGYTTVWYGKWHLSTNDQSDPCDYSMYGFSAPGTPHPCPTPSEPIGQLCPSPNGAPGQGLQYDYCIAETFVNWLAELGAQSQPWCTTISLVNPHDVAWYNKFTPNVPAENDPPKRFRRLPPNFETPQGLLAQGKPTLQQNLIAAVDSTSGFIPHSGPGFQQKWFGLLDLYSQVTDYADVAIGQIVNALDRNPQLAANTIVIFTADHGEYAGSHGLRNKGGAAYEEAIRVPLYVRDPTRRFVRRADTERAQLTSSVDLVPLLMTLASGGNAWRLNPRYAYLAGRADLAAMLSNPNAPGRPYIVHATDEDFIEEGPRSGQFGPSLFGLGERKHVIGLRTASAKLGMYSFWVPGTIQINPFNQQTELYDYTIPAGRLEVINSGPSQPRPALRRPALYTKLHDFLVNFAIPNELRAPLPPSLFEVQRQAFEAYLEYESMTGG